MKRKIAPFALSKHINDAFIKSKSFNMIYKSYSMATEKYNRDNSEISDNESV